MLDRTDLAGLARHPNIGTEDDRQARAARANRVAAAPGELRVALARAASRRGITVDAHAARDLTRRHYQCGESNPPDGRYTEHPVVRSTRWCGVTTAGSAMTRTATPRCCCWPPAVGCRHPAAGTTRAPVDGKVRSGALVDRPGLARWGCAEAPATPRRLPAWSRLDIESGRLDARAEASTHGTQGAACTGSSSGRPQRQRGGLVPATDVSSCRTSSPGPSAWSLVIGGCRQVWACRCGCGLLMGEVIASSTQVDRRQRRRAGVATAVG